MAVNLFTGAINNNWNNAGNWSLLAVPTATDGNTATFNSVSPACTVDVTAVCNHLDFQDAIPYSNTITMTNSITVSGNITLTSGMTIAGTGALNVNATGTLTANGKTWPNALTVAGTSQTYTLADTWQVNGTVTYNATTSMTLNGGTLNCNGNLTIGAAGSTDGSTTNIVIIGTCTWSGAGILRNPLTFNSSGTITFASVTFGGTSLTYTAGTMSISGTFTISVTGGATSINTSGMNFSSLSLNANCTVTLLSDLNILGTFTHGGSTSTGTWNGAFNINVSGGFVASLNTTISGTATLMAIGTGNWATAGASAQLRLNFNINTAGTITFGASFKYSTGTMTYTAGTVITTGNTLAISLSTTLDVAGISWNAITFSGTLTITLLDDLNLTGTFTKNGTNTTLTVNGAFNVNCGGSFICGATSAGDIITGTSTFIFNGTGTWSGNGSMTSNLIINTSGTITITTANPVLYRTGTLTYTAGTVVTTNSTLRLSGNVTLNTFGITWRHLDFSANSTITINSLLVCTGTLSITTVSVVFTGTAGWTCGTFTMTTGNQTLENGLTYTVNTSMVVDGTLANTAVLQSSGVGGTAIFNLSLGATQDIAFCDATRIDSSRAQTIWTYKGTIAATTLNWNSLVPQLKISGVF